MKGWAHKSNLPVTGIAGGRAPNLYLVHFINIHIHTHPPFNAHMSIYSTLEYVCTKWERGKKKKKKHPLCNLILILKKSKATTWRLQIYNYRQFVTVDTFIIGKSRWLGRYYIFHFFLKKKHPDLVSIISNHDRQLLKQIFHYYWFTGKNVLFFFFKKKVQTFASQIRWYFDTPHLYTSLDTRLICPLLQRILHPILIYLPLKSPDKHFLCFLCATTLSMHLTATKRSTERIYKARVRTAAYFLH